LSALELTASVGQARAVLDAAAENRDHVYAGVRAEEITSLAAIAEAKAKHAQGQLTQMRLGLPVQRVNNAQTKACPSRKSYPGVAMMQSGQNWRCDDVSASLDSAL
jgi:hypothetical protein